MELKLTRHRGTDADFYPTDPEEVWIDTTRIEAIWEDQYRYIGRSRIEYVRTRVLMYSGFVFSVRETPKEIRAKIEQDDLHMGGGAM